MFEVRCYECGVYIYTQFEISRVCDKEYCEKCERINKFLEENKELMDDLAKGD